MLSLFLENIYSCFSDTDVHTYIYVLQNIYSCFSRIFYSCGNNAVNTEVIMKHSAPWWAQKSMQAHGSSAECGLNSAPSSLLTLSKPDGFGRILHQWIVCLQRYPWLPKCNWNFPDAAFKIRMLDFDIIWISRDSSGLYHNSNRLLHKILVVATALLFLLQRWRLRRTLNFYFCSCSLSSLTKLHVVQLSVPLSWSWRAPGLSQSKVRCSQQSTELATLFALITEILSNL